MFYQDQHFGIAEYFCKETGEDFSFPAHMHHSFEFITVLEGCMTVEVDGQRYDLTKEEGLLIFPEQIHSLESTHSKHLLVIFSPDIVSAYYAQHAAHLPYNPKIPVPSQLAEQIHGLNEHSSILRKKACLYAVCAALDESSQYQKQKSTENGLLHTVFDFVEKHYDADCTLKKLSEAIGYNSSYLSRYFSQTTRMSFLSYVNRYRVSKACYLLKNTDKSILECALDCGYASLRSFDRNFRAYIGTSPKEYRNRDKR